MHGATRLAIDLGTSHTVAVVQRAGRPPQPLLFDNSPVLPSGVFAGDHGDVHTGRDAERLAQVAPHRFEPHPKRRIDEGVVLLGDAEVPVPALLAAVLRRVLQEAGHAGAAPGDATVLTCPADWGRRRRELLLDAARLAGIHSPTLVDEPVAAAAYCVHELRVPVPPGRPLLVFDFGGGTLDLALVRAEPSGPQVVGVGGLEDLGGLDIDAALVGHLGNLIATHDGRAWQRLATPAGTEDLRDRRAFWSEVRAAKEMLSRSAATPVHLPGANSPLYLTREELDRIAGPLVDRAVDETRRLLDRAGVTGADLAAILLVGGSSRIPLVAGRLHARLGIAPVVPEQPELPVVLGALAAAGHGAAGSGGAAGPVTSGPISGLPVSGAGAVPVSSLPMGHPGPAPVSAPAFQYTDSTDPGQPWPAEPPGPHAWSPHQPAQPAQLVAPAQPAQPARSARPAGRGLVLAAVAGAVLLLGAMGAGFWWLGHDGAGASPNAGTAGPGTAGAPNAAGGASRPPAPTDFVWCAGDANVFCPIKPVCYDDDDDEISCDKPHQTQLFAAGFLPGGTMGSSEQAANSPDAKKGCSDAVMKSRSVDGKRTADWARYIQWQWVNGTNYFFCIAGPRNEQNWTGSAFRTD